MFNTIMKKVIDKSKNIFFNVDKRIPNIAIIALSILIVTFNTPILSRCLPNFIIIGLMCVVVLFTIKNLIAVPKYDKITILFLAAYMVVMLLYKIFSVSSAELYYYFNSVQFFFFLLVIIAIYRNISIKQVRLLVFVTIISMLVTMASNVVLYFEYGAYAYTKLFSTHKYTTNSVSTSFSTALLILIGITLVYFLNTKDKKTKILSLSLSVVSFGFVILIAQRLTGVIYALAMAVVIILISAVDKYKKHLTKKRVILILSIIFALLVIFALFYEPILKFIGDLVGSNRIDRRINQIIKFLKSGDVNLAGGSLKVRYNLIVNSIKTFLSSPINVLFGAGDHRVNNEIIGNHSQLFDEFARYGVMFTLVLFILMYRSFVTVKNAIDFNGNTVLKKQIFVLFIVFVSRALFGNMFYGDVGIQIYLMVPLLMIELNNRQKINNNA